MLNPKYEHNPEIKDKINKNSCSLKGLIEMY